MKPIFTLKALFDIFIGRKVKAKIAEIRYKIELGGKCGIRVTGPWGYPGRFLTKEKIIELIRNLNRERDFICLHIPSVKYNGKYYDNIEIKYIEENNYVIELLEADAQSYVYQKHIDESEIEQFIENIEFECVNPTESGFNINEF